MPFEKVANEAYFLNNNKSIRTQATEGLPGRENGCFLKKAVKTPFVIFRRSVSIDLP
jgi:hypothetical protein